MMKATLVMMVLVLVCGLMLVSAAPQSGSGRCVPGTKTQRDCNTCTCTSTGVLGCTFKACLGGSSNSNRPRPIGNSGGFPGNSGFPGNFGNFNNFGNFGNFFRRRG